MLIMITLEIYGIGFELSLGEIDKSKFEYWKDREISEEDASKKNNELSLFSDHWTDLNDIFHDNGPAMLENTKLEVKENDKIILETYLGAQDLDGSKINYFGTWKADSTLWTASNKNLVPFGLGDLVTEPIKNDGYFVLSADKLINKECFNFIQIAIEPEGYS